MYQAEVHWSVFLWAIIFGIVGLAIHFFWILAILVAIWAYLKRSTTELAVTNKRAIAKFGILRSTTVEQRLEMIDNIQVSQGILQRLFGSGSINITGSGASQTRAPVTSIADPFRFRSEVNAAIDDLKKQSARPAAI